MRRLGGRATIGLFACGLVASCSTRSLDAGGTDTGDSGDHGGGDDGDGGGDDGGPAPTDDPPDDCDADPDCDPPDAPPDLPDPPDPYAAQLDLLFVIDNTIDMAEEQRRLVRSLPRLAHELVAVEEAIGAPFELDVNVMVTTTDFGNPLCPPSSYSEPRDPERGAPIATGCNERIERFGVPGGAVPDVGHICHDVCPVDLVPSDPFINRWSTGDNLPDVPAVDIDGDGEPDEAFGQALACLGAVGIDGCEYAAPLETMLQALNPGAEWNMGARPFLRPNAALGIVLATNELDCSIKDFTVMDDPDAYSVDPADGLAKPSHAICWNAGVSCDGPDATGVYTDCESTTDDRFQPTSRYINYLVGELGMNQLKEVFMIAFTGVPPVTEHLEDPPFAPTAGGMHDLVHRVWNDAPWPSGDLLPEDADYGVDAADLEFRYGVGPGCVAVYDDGTAARGMPPVRIREVCEALDIEGGPPRCCMESVCDDDSRVLSTCLQGMLYDVFVP